MSEEKDILQAQTSVGDILDALGVVRVVNVDDANSKIVSLEDVIAAAIAVDSPHLLSAFPELGNEIPDDPDVLRQKVRDVWEQMDPANRETRGRAILIAARRHDGGTTDDLADFSILSDLVPSSKLVPLSPDEWKAQRDQLLLDSQHQRTLFLFDQKFSETVDDSEAGIKIIASLIRGDATASLICGLLTHTASPETQLDEWRRLSDTYSIPQDRFVVITKQYLSQAPILFAQALKFASLSPEFTQLKAKTKEIIAQAATVAANRVDKVNIYDLDHIVFQVSLEEGLWEPDMLFRLHALFHRLESRRLAHQGGALEAIAAKLRAVSGIPTSSALFPPPSSSWALQREELYESDQYINNNYLPLELGDIFERVGTTSNKKYILLAQPCDLMVRANGERRPELDRLPLAEVVCTSSASPYSEELPYFDESTARKWYVRLKFIHYVRASILDLCVFNQNGEAKINVATHAPSGIRPAWKNRFDILSRYWSRAIGQANRVAVATGDSPDVKQFKQQIAVDMKRLLFNDSLFKGALTEADGAGMVTYNCKRVGRLSRARAIGLLMSYTATLARPAYDREFGDMDG